VNPRAVRAAAIAAILAAGVGAAILFGGSGGDPKASTSASPTASGGPIPGCMPLPERASNPRWLPRTLPLPRGSYTAKATLARAPFNQAVFAVKGNLHDFVTFVLAQWPAKGWTLGRGDAEPGEAEDAFFRPGGKEYGAFRATTTLCDQNWTYVYIAIGTQAAAVPTLTPTTTASSSPLVP
jgi:hypothetical protein